MRDGDDNQQEPVSTERQSFDEVVTNVRICFDAYGSAGGVGKLRLVRYLARGFDQAADLRPRSSIWDDDWFASN